MQRKQISNDDILVNQEDSLGMNDTGRASHGNEQVKLIDTSRQEGKQSQIRYMHDFETSKTASRVKDNDEEAP